MSAAKSLFWDRLMENYTRLPIFKGSANQLGRLYNLLPRVSRFLKEL